jgi:hypothetical protein
MSMRGRAFLDNGWASSEDLSIASAKFLLRLLMTDKTKPVSIRLAESEIDQLHARAYSLSASVTGVARELIRTGLAGGNNKAFADRLMLIERRLVALEQQGQETHARVQSIDQAARDLLTMFEALLKVLTVESTGRAA